MMYGKSALICVGLAILLAGCGPKTASRPSDADVASQAQALINDFVQKAKSQPDTGAQELELVLESLEAQAAEYGGAHEQLRDAAKELKSLYESSASQEEVNQKLDAMAQQAAGLSG